MEATAMGMDVFEDGEVQLLGYKRTDQALVDI
jgi:hypothetical protein